MVNKAHFRKAKYDKHGDNEKHYQAKQMLRAILKQAGYGVEEEVPVHVDLHEYPEKADLYPKRHIKPYKLDLKASRRIGKDLRVIGVEVDGEYHEERREEDALKDAAVLWAYNIPIVRFDKLGLLGGAYSDQEIREKLGIA